MTDETQAQKPAKAPVFSNLSAATIFMVALLLLVFVGGYFLNDRLSALETSQYGEPEIVVVDVGRIASLYPTAASPEEVRQMIDDVGAVIQSLERSGFVVLDRQSVLAAPEAMYLDARVLFEQAGIDLTQWDNPAPGEAGVNSAISPENGAGE